jgi:hypothetical protein
MPTGQLANWPLACWPERETRSGEYALGAHACCRYELLITAIVRSYSLASRPVGLLPASVP